jgi:hypothetical protein
MSKRRILLASRRGQAHLPDHELTAELDKDPSLTSGAR